jgi:pimeloyl-ACP methyl ester carboxylesterase
MPGTPKGIRAWRVLYHSTRLDGSDIAVSGAFFAPDEPAPAGGYPILAQAHGTTGIAQGCAPSLQPFHAQPGRSSYFKTYIAPYLEAGYAVAMPDYQGMGAPGPYSYLIGELEGKNTLDSVRALKRFAEIPTSDEVFVWGHSQGGHASAFTSQLASGYAPEIKLRAAVLLAPAVELKDLVEHVFSTSKAAPTTGLMLVVVRAWSQVYPDLAQVNLLKPGASLAPVEDFCGLAAILATLRAPGDYFAMNPMSSPAWIARIDENMPQTNLLQVPMFIGQGEQDQIVYPPSTQAFAQAACKDGTAVFFKFYPQAGHLDLPTYATADTLAYMQGILGNGTPPDNCQ